MGSCIWVRDGREASQWLHCPPRSILNVFTGEGEEVGNKSRARVEEGERRGSVKSTRSRLDSHLVAGSQCPYYLLHDSLPYLHQSPTQARK